MGGSGGAPRTHGERPDGASAGTVAVERERELVRRAQRNPSAFDALFAGLWRPVLSYCRVRLGDQDEGEDAAQTVMIEVANRLGRYEPRADATFRSWVFTIAHHRTEDARRLAVRRATLPFPELYQASGPGSAPEEEAIRAATIADLHARMRALPAPLREVVELRAAELETAEIARVLGISADNVRQRQKRALDALRDADAKGGQA